jgi:hypothetical protein
MINKSEFEAWWYHPVTEQLRRKMGEEIAYCREASLEVPEDSTANLLGIRTVAFANRAQAFMDMVSKESVSDILEVKDNESDHL